MAFLFHSCRSMSYLCLFFSLSLPFSLSVLLFACFTSPVFLLCLSLPLSYLSFHLCICTLSHCVCPLASLFISLSFLSYSPFFTSICPLFYYSFSLYLCLYVSLFINLLHSVSSFLPFQPLFLSLSFNFFSRKSN